MREIEVTTEIDGTVVREEDRLRKELERARVALALLKEAIGPDEMRRILNPYCDESTEAVMCWKEASGKGWKNSQTTIKVKGMKALEFLGWFGKVNQKGDQAALLAANPEHYLVRPYFEDGCKYQELIETMGFYGEPMHCILEFPQDVAAAAVVRDAAYPYSMVALGRLAANGMKMGVRAVHQFRDAEDGFEAKLLIQFPDHAPDALIDGHKWHLAIEFNNWVEAARRSLS